MLHVAFEYTRPVAATRCSTAGRTATLSVDFTNDLSPTGLGTRALKGGAGMQTVDVERAVARLAGEVAERARAEASRRGLAIVGIRRGGVYLAGRLRRG